MYALKSNGVCNGFDQSEANQSSRDKLWTVFWSFRNRTTAINQKHQLLIQFQTEKVKSDVWTKSIYLSNLGPARLAKSDRQHCV